MNFLMVFRVEKLRREPSCLCDLYATFVLSRRVPPLAFAMLRFAFLLTFSVWIIRPADAAEGEISFNREILPILSDNCFYCHGPDANHRQADLRLDVRQDAIDYGAIDLNDPGSSLVLERVETDDADMLMPPPDSHKQLTAAQKQLLRRWIEDGAVYESHWAYTPPVRPAVPQLDQQTSNPIDALVRGRLRREGLDLSPPAEPHRLVRRLYLDLTGLPPTPEQTERFVRDPSPDATAALIDQLLASPHYGETMAIDWLDAVRYADTVGFHGDQNMHAWAYRDYVIDAFNKNKPFDEFTIEQLAGDLLPNPTPEQLTATCFNRLNMMTREGGAQPKEYLSKYAADRVRTVGTAFLGSTFGCAECHDHKFDPITAKDFYSLAAYFADLRQWGVYADYSYTRNLDLIGWNNDYPFAPEIEVPNRYMQHLLGEAEAELEGFLDTQRARVQDEPKLQAAYAATISRLKQAQPVWQTLSVATQSEKANNDSEAAKSAEGKSEDAAETIARLEADGKDQQVDMQLPAGTFATFQLEVLPIDGKNSSNGSQTHTDLSPKFQLVYSDSRREDVPIDYAWSDDKEPLFVSGEAIDGVHNQWRLPLKPRDRECRSLWRPVDPIVVAADSNVRLNVRLPKNRVFAVRLSVSPLPATDAYAAGVVSTEVIETTENPTCHSVATWLASDPDASEMRRRLQELQQSIRRCNRGLAPVMIAEAVEPAVTRVLPRGDWQNESGEIVLPAIPAFLNMSQPDEQTGQRQTRLDLARWLVSDENPLTARVFVNRLWQHFFGEGLSQRADDFGAQGVAPENPELLDFLAVEFRDSGWDVKRLVKLIVSSQTYAQSSAPNSEAQRKDPDARWLSYFPPRRLEAELVRDNALAIAGLIDLTPGGPSIKPYQPEGYYAGLQFPDRQYLAEQDNRQYRRGVYMHWQRTFLHPMLLAFGAPTREDCIAARIYSNTPQQALTLLNDPSMVEASKVLAWRLLAEAEDDQARIERAFELAVAHPPSEKQSQSLQELLGRLRRHYAEHADEAQALLEVGMARSKSAAPVAEQAAWTNVARVVLNLHETLTLY